MATGTKLSVLVFPEVAFVGSNRLIQPIPGTPFFTSLDTECPCEEYPRRLSCRFFSGGAVHPERILVPVLSLGSCGCVAVVALAFSFALKCVSSGGSQWKVRPVTSAGKGGERPRAGAKIRRAVSVWVVMSLLQALFLRFCYVTRYRRALPFLGSPNHGRKKQHAQSSVYGRSQVVRLQQDITCVDKGG